LPVEFNFLNLVFTLRLEADIADPYLLFGMRADFADIFQQVGGCSRTNCEACPHTPACPYHLVFSQAISPDPSAVRRFQKPPLPFVFDLPLLPTAPNRGRTIEMGLTLAGPAANHVGSFLEAVRIMFGRWQARRQVVAVVAKVESADHLGNRAVIAEPWSGTPFDRLFFLSADGLDKSAILSHDAVSIEIVTPLRIIKDGRPLRELSFAALARSLFRRMSAIYFYYGGMEPELDYKWLSSRCASIGISSNEFRWVEWDKGLSGIIGSGTFTGDLTDFHQFLLFGEYFHAGKGASYGLGRYRLEKAVNGLKKH
jgi:CRISPR/Cas system endoribonuclease Cas6 (RAMP superfamily)